MTSQTTAASQQIPQDQFVIHSKNLSKRFNREWIFRNFDFEITSGKTYAVIGPNGSGKSTLLQILWGQVPPTAGSIDYQINGKEVEMEQLHEHISIAAPYMDLIEEFTLLEQLRFHFRLKKISEGLSIPDLLQIGKLSGAENKFIGNFSSGLKQRIKLCLAFYSACPVLFLDEPGTNLDATSFEWYKDQLSRCSANRAVVIASNNPAEYPTDSIQVNLSSYK